MDLRRAGPDDAALLATLHRHVHDGHAAAEPLLYRQTDREEVTAWFRGRLTGSDIVFIAEEADQPLGYAMVQLVDRPGHLFVHARRFLLLDQLAVAPDARRRGIGRALMTTVETFAAENGMDGVELDVRQANPIAIAFYSALGYRTEQLRLRRQLTR